MTAVAFDTLKLARALRAADFTPAQAEGAAEAIATAIQSDLPTKADLKAGLDTHRAEMNGSNIELRAEMSSLKTELRAEMRGLSAETHALVADAKADLIKWTIGIVFVQGGLVVGLVHRLH